MSWVLVVQAEILMVTAALLIQGLITVVIDKRREDDIRRKEAGL